MKNIRFQKGFTLIELLIVITIIGILAVALLPSVLGAPARARDAARKADMNNIIAGIETFNSDHQNYPAGKICIGSDNPPNDDYGKFKALFQNATPPSDPQKSSAKVIGGCQAGDYLYCQLSGSPAGYYVAAYMEQDGDGNMNLSELSAPECSSTALAPDIAKDTDTATAVAYVIVK